MAVRANFIQAYTGSFITFLNRIKGLDPVDDDDFATKGYIGTQTGKVYTSGMALTEGDKITSPVDDLSARILCEATATTTASSSANAITDFAADLASGLLRPLQTGAFVADKTYTVGAGGMFSTITQAIDYLSNFRPVQGALATINLLSGFTMAEQVVIKGWDASWIEITSVDPTVTISRIALSVDQTTTDYGFASFSAFTFLDGTAGPKISALFSMNVTGDASDRNGITCVNHSSVTVSPGKGVQNAGGSGLYCRDISTAEAVSAVFTGALANGIHAVSARINAGSANCSNAGARGVFSSTSSDINFTSGTATGCATGIYSLGGSFVTATSANVSSATAFGAQAQRGSTIEFFSGNATGAGTTGISVLQGGIIAANSATGTLSQTAVTPTSNGIIFQ